MLCVLAARARGARARLRCDACTHERRERLGKYADPVSLNSAFAMVLAVLLMLLPLMMQLGDRPNQCGAGRKPD